MQTFQVLIADGERKFVRELRDCFLEDPMYRNVEITGSGAKAMELLRERKPDILVIDMILEERDGLWVLEQMKEQGISVKACMVASAVNQVEYITKALSLGAEYYMVKPLQPSLLIDRL